MTVDRHRDARHPYRSPVPIKYATETSPYVVGSRCGSPSSGWRSSPSLRSAPTGCRTSSTAATSTTNPKTNAALTSSAISARSRSHRRGRGSPTPEKKIGNGPERTGIFGTDRNGYDLFSRSMFGARNSLMIGILSITFGLLFGTIFGMISGYYRGWTDRVIEVMTNILLAFPALLLGDLHRHVQRQTQQHVVGGRHEIRRPDHPGSVDPGDPTADSSGAGQHHHVRAA